MLVNLDVLIGLSVIMLGLSLIVTILGQAASNAFGVRGTNLRWGLSMLIQSLHTERFQPPAAILFDRDLDKRALSVADAVLRFPLLSDSKFPYGRWKLPSAVRFEEFSKTVALLGPSSGNADLKWLSENSRITEPWFNSIMDRVSQRFTMHMRIYTVILSAAVVFITGVDTLFVLKTLRTDVSLRAGLVSAAQSISEKNGTLNPEDMNTVREFARNAIGGLPKDQSVWSVLRPSPSWPSPSSEWPDRLPGLLLSIGLLSLGAPFWFNALKNLTALRPIVANKEEKERALQSSTPDVGDRIRWKDL